MLLFCPICSNLLLIQSNEMDGRQELYCQSCPYVSPVTTQYKSMTKLDVKQVDDVLGGADAWKNVDSTEATCPKCEHTRAYYMQIQIRIKPCMTEGIQNLRKHDPFAEQVDDDDSVQAPGTYIHIRIQQRNGRKTLTTIQGIPADLDQKRLLKAFKKVFACNGTIVEDEEMGEVIQLQGDHRTKVSQFLIEEKICSKDQVKVHGF